MALIVQKYGGTSVADPDRMRAVAENVEVTRSHGNDVVVVVSAMGKATDNLIQLANDVSAGSQPGRELDMLLTTGERVTMALLCMALADSRASPPRASRAARSGSSPTRRTARPRSSRSRATACAARIADGNVCVVAGFQGVSTDNEITTLGRGGSDATAVALAAALGADACEIYTDVTGVFTADPRVVPQARKLPHVQFDEMLEMAGAGSEGADAALGRVRPQLQRAPARAVGVHVGSRAPGSPTVRRHGGRHGRARSSRASATDVSESKVTIARRARPAGHLRNALFEPLAAAERERRHDRAEHLDRRHDRHQLHHARSPTCRRRRRSSRRGGQARSARSGVTTDADIAKVSLVGAGMKSSPGIAAKMFRVLADEDVNIEMISTSTIRISRGDPHRRRRAGGPAPAHGVRPRQRAGLLGRCPERK